MPEISDYGVPCVFVLYMQVSNLIRMEFFSRHHRKHVIMCCVCAGFCVIILTGKTSILKQILYIGIQLNLDKVSMIFVKIGLI